MTVDAATPQDRRQWVLAALDQYEGRLTRYAARLLRDEHAARDAVQHTFLRLCDRPPEAAGQRLACWLFTVCRNKALDLIRKNGRMESLAPAGSADLAGRDDDPAERAERAELYVQLRTLVEQLPANQREVIDLWTQGFTYREIAEISGRREGNIRVLVHRALVRLREHPRTRQWLAEEQDSDAAESNGEFSDIPSGVSRTR
jgi:RNA polymerase sigma factor (sigma-70 family)